MLCGGLVRAKCNVRGWGDGAGVRLTEGSIYRESEQVGVKTERISTRVAVDIAEGPPACTISSCVIKLEPCMPSVLPWNRLMYGISSCSSSGCGRIGTLHKSEPGDWPFSDAFS
jgi:hypothetical protein